MLRVSVSTEDRVARRFRVEQYALINSESIAGATSVAPKDGLLLINVGKVISVEVKEDDASASS